MQRLIAVGKFQMVKKSEKHFENVRLQKRRAWLGDAIVLLIVRKILAESFPLEPMRDLDRFAHRLISNNFLNRIATEIGLDDCRGGWKAPATRLERFLAERFATDGIEGAELVLAPHIFAEISAMKAEEKFDE